jgi:beta-glucosidase
MVVLLWAVVAFSQSGDFTNQGKVVTANGQGLAMATITYMSIAKRLSWDFSRTDGTFGTGGTAVNPPAASPAFITIAARGPVYIDVFDASGKLVGTAYCPAIEKGRYSLEPVCANLPRAMYLLKIKAGGKTYSQKMITTGIRGAGAAAYTLSSENTPLVRARKCSAPAAIDTVRIGKTGYAPVFKPINSYTEDVGTVTLTAVNIDSMVNAYFGKMNQLQKCGQMAMPAFPSASVMASNFCGGAFGGGGCFSGYAGASATANLFDGFQNAMMGTSLKIPAIVAYDAVHGASAVPGAVIFPHNMGMGAIQDTLLVQKGFRVAALELRGSGANWGFGPCIAVIRDDRWGRAYEGFCETPERTQVMARHSVLGLQLTDLSCPMTQAACLKHFAGDGNTKTGIDRGQTDGTDAQARAINLPGYTAGVAAGAATIMPSFSSWTDGVAMHRNKTLLTDWLKNGASGGPSFKGFVVGDYEAGWPLPASMDAGLDMPMAPGAGVGIISTNSPDNFNNMYATYGARLDDAVKRILRVKCWMNLFSPNQYLTDRRLTSTVGSAEHRAVARACVRSSMVLLKNANQALPIPKNGNVTLWGQGGDDIGIQCGGWVVSWQGSTGTPTSGGTTIRQGCQAQCTGTFTYSSNASQGANANYIVAVLSENPYAEVSFPDISLTNDVPNGGVGGNTQRATATNQAVMTAIQTAHSAGKKVIVVLIAGRPMNVTSVLPNCDAFIWACLPGTEGNGVSDVLFGDHKFSGKLPVTWPNSVSDEPINQGDGKTGLFAYGAGLTN